MCHFGCGKHFQSLCVCCLFLLYFVLKMHTRTMSTVKYSICIAMFISEFEGRADLMAGPAYLHCS